MLGLLKAKDEALRVKDEDLRVKDAQLTKLNAELRAATALAAELRYSNLARLRVANVTEVRAALDVCLQNRGLRGGSAAVFAQFFTRSPSAAASALDCCNKDAKVLGDNDEKEHSLETLAAELARIKRRLNKDSHPKRSSGQYHDKGDRLLLARDGLSDSDVVILSCLFTACGYPVQIVDDVQLADPPRGSGGTLA